MLSLTFLVLYVSCGDLEKVERYKLGVKVKIYSSIVG